MRRGQFVICPHAREIRSRFPQLLETQPYTIYYFTGAHRAKNRIYPDQNVRHDNAQFFPQIIVHRVYGRLAVRIGG